MSGPGALRLMVYDKTRSAGRGLTLSWRVGGWLYGALDRFDGWTGAKSWDEALDWLASFRAPARIEEIQFWGHGNWGNVKLGGVPLDVRALEPSHRWHPRLAAIRSRLVPGGAALWWFRTCETFGRAEGQAFAASWVRFFGCRAAGHTYVIGPLQSGLHVLAPGQTPAWPLDEGLPHGGAVGRARRSMPGSPNTVSFLSGKIPRGF
ncbi:MAG: hypothetical protein ACYC8T_23270 [Myxococcaceae bacterium]